MTSTAHSASPLEQAIIVDPVIVTPASPLGEVVLLMNQAQEESILAASDPSNQESYLQVARAGCVLVAQDGELFGVFTNQDLVRMAASGRQPGSVPVGQVITPQPVSLTRSQLQDPIAVLKYFHTQQITHLPIVDEHRQIVGLITTETLYRQSQSLDLLKSRMVAEAMTKDVVRAPLGVSMLAIAQLMAEQQANYVIITNTEGMATLHPEVPVYPVGIITSEDIVQAQAIGIDFVTIPASAVMNTPLACLSPQDTLWTAHQKMQRRHAKQMAVIGSQGELIGILHQSTLHQYIEPAEMYLLVESLQQRITQLEERQAELERLHKQDQQELIRYRSAYQRLRYEESKQRQLLEAATVGIWVFDKSQQTSFVNHHLLTTLGYTYDEMVGRPLSAFLESDDQATIPLPNADDLVPPALPMNGHYSAETHAITKQELRLRCKDNSFRWMLMSTQPLYSNTKDFLGVVTILTDLSETNLFDRQLQRLLSDTTHTTGQNFLETLVQRLAEVLAMDCVLITQVQNEQLQTHAAWVNGQLRPSITYAIANSPDKRTLYNGDYCCAQELQRHFPNLEPVLPSGLESYLGVVLRASEGEVIGTMALWSTRAIHMTYSLKTLLQLFAPRVVTELNRQRELDELQQTAENLRRELQEQSLVIQDGEKRFCDIANSLPVFLWMATEREKRWFSNRAWTDFTGRDRYEQLGHGWTEHIHADDINHYLDAYLAAFDAHEPLTIEYRLKHKDTKDYHWIVDQIAPRKNPDGSFAGYIGVGFDITAYRQTINRLQETLQRQQQDSEKRLANLTKILRQFRKPLATIVDQLKALASDTSHQSSSPSKHLARIQASVQQMGELLENGLIANQIETDELSFNPQTVNLVQVCEEIVNRLKNENPDHVFRTNFWQEDIRGDQQLMSARLDPKLLQRILQCLISNAVKYSPPKSTIQIRLIKGLKGQDLVAIEVQDEGIGIPKDIQSKLFRAFRRAPNVGDVPGDGIGLVVVKRCLDLHGGDITFESKPGCTLFRVMLRVQFLRDDTSHGGDTAGRGLATN
ncbi:MAG: PAS domain S-box protein [Cyanobacteria bacterium]|nr:PAS domain S-box protein [Cyanobacteriota bacterium]MDW8202468.1 PAS domain S-box protein [Cyanobacteriota bacterium SKYGB_h_bin112]